jgi:cytochrome c oxidase assembly factor 2
MPPHLHPRSTATSTLFAGTLLASFTVVAIPHLFPCPRPRRAYADTERQLDSEGRPAVRRKRRKSDEQQEQPAEAPEASLRPPAQPTPMTAAAAGRGNNALASTKERKDLTLEDEAALFRQFQGEAQMLEKEARECPVPKPGGVLGRLLGFQQDEKEDAHAKVPRNVR